MRNFELISFESCLNNAVDAFFLQSLLHSGNVAIADNDHRDVVIGLL
jgi:hypothetical protein